MKTLVPKITDFAKVTHELDAESAILGRLSTKIAGLLMGKHKVNYMPNFDMGDSVTVVNVEKIKVTGKKESQKKYYRHSGFPGGFREIAYSKLKKEAPAKILEMAVKRMLPKNRLQAKRMARLKLVVGDKK